ncbi:MAG: YbaK/EbsC family protein [Spirochaetaceae bacterium]|jgi:prolyl-tRNA editing enzyme YbaK/EbsC (Cys-tRNA(Pro) deacylase)|nr:YbaK/EbsC family protein [Spirochaetaceae bacterium]
MSVEAVRAYLDRWGRGKDVQEKALSTATVLEAAAALGVLPARIAKSISLKSPEGAIIVVAAGDTKLDNKKFKTQFGYKASMLSPEDALRLTGHAIGGVCPFALPPDIKVYLDASLKRFDTIFPACGSSNSMIELTPAELEAYSNSAAWIDVCQTVSRETNLGGRLIE